jgi:hypothetical protein
MKTILSVIAAIGVAAFTTAVYADDHLATAVAAGGLTTDKQPFNIDNPGKGGEEAPVRAARCPAKTIRRRRR